jgi:tetratricopeptide (TPR) repeat protein
LFIPHPAQAASDWLASHTPSSPGKPMLIDSPSLKKSLAAFLLLAAVSARGQAPTATPPAETKEAEDRAEGVRGLDLMMDGDLDGATEVFRRLQRSDSQSPLGYLLEADACWWRIYYSTANLVDPDVFAATDLETTPFDAHFEDLLNLAIRKAEARRHAKQDVARSYLYAGMAYALRARLTGLRDKDLPTARAGKKMRTLLLAALAMDPKLVDAYLGVGIYNYFVDTLSAIVKVLRFFIGLPGGSRIVGLQQLQLAADKGELVRAEAKFYLAKDYSRSNEKQYAKSIKLFEELSRQYPHNPLWPMLIGSLNFRIGQRERGEAIYREVFQKTAGQKSEVDQEVHKAARQALERLHPDQKLE